MTEYAAQLSRLIRWVGEGGHADDPMAVSVRERSDPVLMELLDQLLKSADQDSPDAILDAVHNQLVRAARLALRGPVGTCSRRQSSMVVWRSRDDPVSRDVVYAGRLGLVFERDGRVLCEVMLDDLDRYLIRGIIPGAYLLRLNTGRVLWRDTLTRQRLVTRQNPEGRYRAAASARNRGSEPGELLYSSDTGAGQQREGPLHIEGETECLQLALFRGFDVGSIEIRLTPNRRAG